MTGRWANVSDDFPQAFGINNAIDPTFDGKFKLIIYSID